MIGVKENYEKLNHLFEAFGVLKNDDNLLRSKGTKYYSIFEYKGIVIITTI